jgi:hypothetical protein
MVLLRTQLLGQYLGLSSTDQEGVEDGSQE